MAWLVLVIAIVNAYIDYRIIKSGRWINHKVESISRAIIIGTISSSILEFVLGCIIFWLVFEITLNFLRKKSILYVGHTAWSDKTIRRMFPKNTEFKFFIIKIILLCLSGLAYFLC